MNVTDIIIIYLACGSPFGVYQITKRQPARLPFDWVSVVSSFLFWPAYAGSLLAGRFFPNDERIEADRHNRIEDIRIDIERIAFSGESISSLFEFREVFYRFTGLSEAANAQPAGKSTNEIFEISGHRNKVIASRCLARRNSGRLAFHQARAQHEFVDLMSQLTNSALKRDEIIGLALELADQIGDSAAGAKIAALPSERPKPASTPKADPAKIALKPSGIPVSAVN